MKQPNQHPCLIAHAIVIVHALYTFTVSIFSFTDWFNKCQSGDLKTYLWSFSMKKWNFNKNLFTHVCFIAVWIRFEINVLNWCCRDWRFDRELALHYSKAVLLWRNVYPLNYTAEIRSEKRGAPLLVLSSEGITLCATNFSAAHKEFMKCAIKTRKLKLGSTQNAKNMTFFWWYQSVNCVTIWTSFYAINFPFIRNFIGAKFDNTCILAFQLFVSYIFQQNSDLRNQIVR